MVAKVRKATSSWSLDAVTIGYPGPVVNNRPAAEPKNLASGWRAMNYAKAFGKKRVRLVNDAAMQALGSYRGGRMLFLGLGTGLGSALVVDGELAPLELAHLPYRKGGTYEDYVGKRGMKRLGPKRWRKHVHRHRAPQRRSAGRRGRGGRRRGEDNQDAPAPGCGRVENDNAILGGLRIWADPKHRT